MHFDFAPFAADDRNTARMSERVKRIVLANPDAYHGRRVLDLAANNGRWTYAAAVAGAAQVTSVEGRADMVAEARVHLTRAGVANICDLHQGDMFDFLAQPDAGGFDTILCLGVFYHVMDHARLLRLMTRQQPQAILIDSGFLRSFRAQVHVQFEDPDDPLNALPAYAGQPMEPVGTISLGLMLQLAWNNGYRCRPMIWDPAEVADRGAVQDYMSGRRYTLRLDRITGHADPDWQAPWRDALTRLQPKFADLFDPERHDRVTDARARGGQKQAPFSVLGAD